MATISGVAYGFPDIFAVSKRNYSKGLLHKIEDISESLFKV